MPQSIISPYRGWSLEIEPNGRTAVRDGSGQWFATVETEHLGRKWVDTFKAVSAASNPS